MRIASFLNMIRPPIGGIGGACRSVNATVDGLAALEFVNSDAVRSRERLCTGVEWFWKQFVLVQGDSDYVQAVLIHSELGCGHYRGRSTRLG